ncbi:MAG: peptidase U32 family protein [Paracoccus sp. (in: a-proteobacteria)]|uniref:peptidase U32 family protein n=1 Tax=Paracoccus sp. TaxID=267 RepID=UPI0026DF5300|nr:peptidase U32 family protein [Paracoccus sp. (in: a-proteobacteria)]MDO5631360.1 peptidase U32 family protein [Paracoccus sp. (in: a-proteobacteria)]
MELVCPAGTPAALRAAVDAGAHTVYCGFADDTNARNFPGLNFSLEEMAEGVGYAHARGSKVLVAINTFPRAGAGEIWHRAVANAQVAGADAVILADLGLLDYAATHHPDLRRHLSVQAAAANSDAINFYTETFGVRRVVLPRVLTVDEIRAINREIDVETEVFVFGGLCVMAEGRCSLSSYVTGKSPNMNGVCSPASHVVYSEEADGLRARLGGFTIHKTPAGHPAPYPTLAKAGVTALKIEGRQRSRAYVAEVVRTFRVAVEAEAAGQPLPVGVLARLTEGQSATTGAYTKTWR